MKPLWKRISEKQIDKLNGITLSDKEFDRLMTSLLGKSRFECAKNLRQDQIIEFDSDGKKHSVKIFERDDWCRNLFQVTNQVTVQGKHENRFDVTILVNGLPLVQIELKRRGQDLKKAYDQIARYQRETYKRLFYYIQIFVISNGVNTRYYANNTEFDKDYVFTWQDTDNKPVNNLIEFSNLRLTKCNLAKTISEFMVLNNSAKTLVAMRPYQVRAVENLVNLAKTTKNNGYIWHTTGSGKTITSFKLAQILKYDPNIDKVFFLIDRVDLNTQTIGEFNKFEENCFADTVSAYDLVKKVKDTNNRLIMTTIQKMSNACASDPKAFAPYANSSVFIIDECHRSNFGEMHKKIRKVFTGGQFFGFTGTPIFEKNKANLDFTTATVFGGENGCRDKYLIGEAIRDGSVLGFNVQYYETLGGTQSIDRPLTEAEKDEVKLHADRIHNVSLKILDTYSKETYGGRYNALFANDSIASLLLFYDELRKLDGGKHKICAVYTFESNDELEPEATESQRDALDRIIQDYNKMFGTDYSTDNGKTASYYADVQKRLQNREIDLLLVVDMFLTGFNSKWLSALYLDKSLCYHRLIQAFSRTNRVDGEMKPAGNIVSFTSSVEIKNSIKPQRVLGTYKDDTDAAVGLFANKETKDVVLIKTLPEYVAEFKTEKMALDVLVKKPSDCDLLETKADKIQFLKLFLPLIKTTRIMNTFVEFDFNQSNLGMTRQDFEDYVSKYKDIVHDIHVPSPDGEIENVESEFSVCLVQNDLIDFEYILNLIKGATQIEKGPNRIAEIERIIKLLSSCSNDSLKYRKELLTRFLQEVVPGLGEDADIDGEFAKFVDDEREKDLKAKAADLNLIYDELEALFKEYSVYEYINDSKIEAAITPASIEKQKSLSSKPLPRFKAKTQLIEEIRRYIEDVCKKYY